MSAKRENCAKVSGESLEWHSFFVVSEVFSETFFLQVLTSEPDEKDFFFSLLLRKGLQSDGAAAEGATIKDRGGNRSRRDWDCQSPGNRGWIWLGGHNLGQNSRLTIYQSCSLGHRSHRLTQVAPGRRLGCPIAIHHDLDARPAVIGQSHRTGGPQTMACVASGIRQAKKLSNMPCGLGQSGPAD